MKEIKEQRYVVETMQGSEHFFFPYTHYKKVIEDNKKKILATFNSKDKKIIAIIVQEPTSFYSSDNFMIYEGDEVLFQKDGKEKLYMIEMKNNSFYGLHEDALEQKEYVLMDDNYVYSFEDGIDFYNTCMCCSCCGCSCYEDFEG